MTRKREPWMRCYKLVGKLAVPVADATEWARSFEKANRYVAQTQIGGVLVSTIFLGLDHNFLGNEPLLFETMIFRGGEGDETFRCSSWDEAEKQHAEAVALVRAAIKDKVND